MRLSETLGFATSKHKDWFDDQDTEAQGLLELYSPSVDERQELLGQEDGLHSSETEGAAQAP